ncbi:protein RRNAD1 isoform X3 [Latimeria chalumnae]|uniref:protein RRNAD1 isoform X3 n=2 Tax=Latimeria chalumnae TaxID=7897 RepID=UPI0003C1A90F|nr:PREDICTED: protein RRNAD1 isoform X3 [Latimeria chalumnae]|eukprot:XP_005991713.1 PREDICTED: protein RRNAD1 isoform X3 [Latimeria chalumnae]
METGEATLPHSAVKMMGGATGRLSLEQQKQLSANIVRVVSTYSYILDSYIIEFFSENLWMKLPPSWQTALSNLPAPLLAAQLLEKTATQEVSYRCVWPLSLLAFKATAQTLAFPRSPCEGGSLSPSGLPAEFQENECQSSMLKHIFRKHVKPKKQHEIRQLGKLVKKLCDATGCQQVVDVGSGQGHLSRFLSFGFNLSVTGVEANRDLVTMAIKFDQELVCTLHKELKRATQQCGANNCSSAFCSIHIPHHVVGWVNPSASWEEFLQLLQSGDKERGSCLYLTESERLRTTDKTHRGPTVRMKEVGTNGSQNRDRQNPCSLEAGDITEMRRQARKSNVREQLLTSELGEDESACCKAKGPERQKPKVNCIEKVEANNPSLTLRNVFSNGADCSRGAKLTTKQSNVECLPASVLPLFKPDEDFVLTGLHACGDLSVTLLRYFVSCPKAVAITSVACCYMKITTEETPVPSGVVAPPLPFVMEPRQEADFGFPVSTWVRGLPGHKLSYKSREVACHAIEDYMGRLKNKSKVLRTHCYRAVLETIIRGIDPAMKRQGIQTIKKVHELPFKEYARLGLERVGLDPNIPLDDTLVESMLSHQEDVTTYFCLALLLAPLVETLILLDRMIYLQEEGFQCELVPLFDPKFSPRNLVIVATKTHQQDGGPSLVSSEPGATGH